MHASAARQPGIAIIVDQAVPPPVAHGLAELEAALVQRGLACHRQATDDATTTATSALVVGLAGVSPLVTNLLSTAGVALPAIPEALAFQPVVADGAQRIVIAGSDARGLLYALTEAARRVVTAESLDDLAALFPAAVETPELALRSICLFPHNEALEKVWFYDRAHWEALFADLARARFNTFTLIFGHQTAYFSPPYPFFVDVPEHPEVTVPGLAEADRDRNLANLRMIAQVAVDHGLDFALGVWQQHAHEYGRSRLDGLTDANLLSFCAIGMRRLLEAVPEISGVQLRVNAESGILLSEEPAFWRAIFAAVKESGRPLRLNIRAKAILDDTIEAAMATGLPVEVCTKHWMEHMGLPYLATDLQLCDRLVRRHGYNDLLPQGHGYDFVFQLWNLGTNKLFLWADPAWARDFARSCQLGGARGFEVCMPLSNKGFRDVGGDWPIFADPSYAWYRWEYERYWPWYLVIGRFGYRSDAPESVWRRELETRFGVSAAPHLAEAYQQASRFLPLITAAHAPSASVFGYWPEKDTGGLLDFYLEVEPSDLARFYGVTDYARAYLAGHLSAKLTPAQVADRLDDLANRALAALAEADDLVDEAGAAEYRGTRLDLTAQALLARYHAAKRRAAEGLAFFYAAGDVDALRRAQRHAELARDAWAALVGLTRGVYQDNLIFGAVKDQVGHWQDHLAYVEHDLARLAEVEAIFLRYGQFDYGFDFGPPPAPRTSHWVQPIVSDYPVERRFTGVFTDTLYTPERGYGWHANRELVGSVAPAVSVEVWRGSAPNPTALPANMLLADFVARGHNAHYDNHIFLVDLPNGLYEVRFLMIDASADAKAHGPMWITVQGRHRIEPFVVPPGMLVEKTLRAPVRNGRLEIEFNADPVSEWIISALVITRVAPHLGHVPPLGLVAGDAWRVAVTATGPETIEQVTLRYRWHAGTGWRELPLVEETSHAYVVTLAVPTDATGLSYQVIAIDAAGGQTTWPAAGERVVPVAVERRPPNISHEPVGAARAGQAVEICATVASAAPLRAVTLYYRNLNQKEPLLPLPLTADGHRYRGTIPADDIVAGWDLLYFIEAVDVLGEAAVFPALETPPPYIVTSVLPTT